ncbi:hypothetical protein Hanom_Chr00s000001g01592761 [Helianthus anomalus]
MISIKSDADKAFLKICGKATGSVALLDKKEIKKNNKIKYLYNMKMKGRW